jgi:nucleoside-diphosphate-sugar epimerase
MAKKKAEAKRNAWIVANGKERRTFPNVLQRTLESKGWNVQLTEYYDDCLDNLIMNSNPFDDCHAVFYVHTPGETRYPDTKYRNMVSAASNFLEEVSGEAYPIVMLSSAEVYGDVEELENPVTEMNDTRSKTLEAAAHVAISELAQAHWRIDGTNVMVVRSFETPDIPEGKLSRMIREMVKVEQKGTKGIVEIASMEEVVDILHTQDLATAMIAVAEKGKAGSIYNCGSAKPVTIGELFYTAMTLMQQTPKPASIELRSTKRDIINRVKYASVERLVGDTGWKPEKTVEQIVGDTLTFWRNTYGNPI